MQVTKALEKKNSNYFFNFINLFFHKYFNIYLIYYYYFNLKARLNRSHLLISVPPPLEGGCLVALEQIIFFAIMQQPKPSDNKIVNP